MVTIAENVHDIPQLRSPPRLSLLVLRAIDSVRLARFYGILGFQFRDEQHGNGPIHHVSSELGLTFEIYPRRPEEPSTTATRLGFATPALDAVVEALVAEGGEVLTQSETTPWGRRAVIRDTEGHKVEVAELESPA